MKAKKIIPPGTRYGKLTVIREVGLDKNSHRLFECSCDCGSVKNYLLINLSNKTCPTRSCGCARNEHEGVKARCREKLYRTYKNMKARCSNPNHPNYHNYGGRGIAVCDDWNSSYASFRTWALSNGYSEGLTLDRINNNGNYEPSNCRWVDMKVQSNNMRKNVRITYHGETHTASEWSDILDIPVGRIRHRFNRNFPLELVFSKERLCETTLKESSKS